MTNKDGNVRRPGFFENGATYIENSVLCNLKSFTPADIFVLLKISHYAQNGKDIYLNTIIEETGLSEEEVKVSTKKLLELDLITID